MQIQMRCKLSKHVHLRPAHAKSSMATHPPSGTSSASPTLPLLLQMTPLVLPQGRSPASFYVHCPLLTKLGPTCRRTLLPGNPSDCKTTFLPARRSSSWHWQPFTQLEKSVKWYITVASALVWHQNKSLHIIATSSFPLSSLD